MLKAYLKSKTEKAASDKGGTCSVGLPRHAEEESIEYSCNIKKGFIIQVLLIIQSFLHLF